MSSDLSYPSNRYGVSTVTMETNISTGGCTECGCTYARQVVERLIRDGRPRGRVVEADVYCEQCGTAGPAPEEVWQRLRI